MFNLKVGFQGGWIERRYFRLDQIYDGGQWPFSQFNKGHVSAMGHQIHFTYVRPLYFALGHHTSLLIGMKGDRRLISQGTVAIADLRYEEKGASLEEQTRY